MLARPADGGLVPAGTPEQAAPSASIDDMPRNGSRQFAQVSRGIAQPLGRQGERVAHRLSGESLLPAGKSNPRGITPITVNVRALI